MLLHISYVSLAQYLRTNGVLHLRAWLVLICTYVFVGEILKSMWDCCKQIFKVVMNDWSIVLLVLILAQTCAYISSHFYFYAFAKELTKCKSQSEKEILSCKSLSHILVFDQEKGKATFVLKFMVLKKPKANSHC